ncbi:pyruvate dehydrogenase (acetyl-transferring), homodimeric type [Thalassoroseus pseudoceratinae]|uniref:pyruvate dehydrogenase (acetyl-transferring), homodimeric type n=1 Tax=Thalassoroseus pseudoceratinae TaxID=2713176 RepID=UPI001423FD19|nr:pyruvate dehydrogenase (acetyl-transferring), homodimeric type [Thalassoroseus pseudoceratinae]
MSEDTASSITSIHSEELNEWFESLDDILHRYGSQALQELLVTLQERAYRRGVTMPFTANTPYINTISLDKETHYPGDLEIERRIKSLVRWNAMAMVVRGNKRGDGIGGHISTFASSATLYEVGYNHFFHARTEDHTGDMVYFQGHAAPGMYARAFLEGRLDESHLENFRREIPRGQGLSSYPHPWLMPEFWQFPTVSMGLGPITAIYHARFLRYMEHRGLLDTSKSHVWAFLGDGECDEPETLGAITLASREQLDNLIFVINCNLQRLDGPVRGNGKIIQELEAAFRGAGWNCIKVVWGQDWDELIAADHEGHLIKRMGEVVDGQFQKYSVESGEYIRNHFFNTPELKKLVAHLSDDQLQKMRRGGHDPEKVFAAYRSAVNHSGAPTVILAKTIKGYGLGEAGEGRNVAHNTKKVNEQELLAFRSRFSIPLSDEEVVKAPFYRPAEDSPEIQYLMKHREKLGGFVPKRDATGEKLEIPPLSKWKKQLEGTGDAETSTTGAFGAIVATLAKDKKVGDRVVPIIPDEARTFGMESFFSMFGIYSSKGQLYEPVDAGTLMYYKEAKNGQVLEEGINEAGAISSFIAAGTAYSNLGTHMIPFYIYYSMFGFQRVGDLVWLAGDSRVKGFLVGGTSGRTTLNGEGLQHEDGHSHLVATTVPNLVAYDPAYAYELAVIIRDGLKRMYADGEEIFYYLSVYNENYVQPPMPEGVEEGILKGIYKLKSTEGQNNKELRPQLFGSGTILREVLRGQEILAEKYGIGCDVWSVTSYSELARDARAASRWNRMHPGEEPRKSYLEELFADQEGPFIASSDNVRLVQDQIREWIPGTYTTLGTDGYGRSDSRPKLRRHFEVDGEFVAYSTCEALSRQCNFDKARLPEVIKELEIDPDQVDPAFA